MNNYKTEEDIELSLKRLNLERQIALEELKSVKGDFKESIQPANWLQSGIKLFSKYGMLMLVKKPIK